jgi:hypothetical protein
MLKYTPTAVNAMPPTMAKPLAACINGVIPCSLVAPLTPACLRVVAKHQAEYQDDQAEQRAEHDESAHVRTPFHARSIL